MGKPLDLGPKVGPDMPADEFEALLERQPKLEARWSSPPMRESCETVEWKDLADYQKWQVVEVERIRARRAEEKVRAIEALVQHGAPFLLGHWVPGTRNGEQRRWKAALREILGMGS